jgi:hypothetical protein
MSGYRTRRLDRSTAERLLTGVRATTDTNADTTTAVLAMVLRAAAAPARPDELTGERAALAAYSNPAQLGPVPESRRLSMLKSTLAKALTVKAALVIAALGASGVALAASAGALPTPWSGPPATPPATSRSHTPPAAPPVTPTGRPSDAGKPSGTGTPAGATPDPSLAGLCQAYTAQVGENPGKALESPAFAALITAAGGRDEVPAYCDALAEDHPTGKPSDLPTPTEHGNAPSTHPTPSNRPSTPGSPARAADPSGGTPPKQGG